MNIVSIVIGSLMLLGFNLKSKDDGKKTEIGVWFFSCTYLICGTALIVVPVLLN